MNRTVGHHHTLVKTGEHLLNIFLRVLRDKKHGGHLHRRRLLLQPVGRKRRLHFTFLHLFIYRVFTHLYTYVSSSWHWQQNGACLSTHLHKMALAAYKLLQQTLAVQMPAVLLASQHP